MPESLLVFILKCFYLMMPAYFANMAPVIVKKINLFVYPIDFDKKINNKPILGKNKTFRGLVFGVIFAVIAAYLQFSAYKMGLFRSISFLDYQNWLLFGLLMGLGALTGDSVKSFFKRMVNIKPGDKFIPFDQIDFVIASLIFVIPVLGFSWKTFLVSLFLSFLLDIMVNHIAFWLRIRDENW